MEFDKQLQRVAGKYRESGYEIIVRPRGKDIPSFARTYEPDLIASRGSEHVVVQVKKDRAELGRDPSLSRLAEITNAQPGWRFDLVILEGETPLEEAAAEADEPSAAQIDQLLNHAERSAKAGDILASFVLAWSGLEAAMRFRSRCSSIGASKPLAPTVLIRTLYSAGALSPEELRRLDKASKVRNQVVHGFVPTKIRDTDVYYLASLARRLIESNGDSSV